MAPLFIVKQALPTSSEMQPHENLPYFRWGYTNSAALDKAMCYAGRKNI